MSSKQQQQQQQQQKEKQQYNKKDDMDGKDNDDNDSKDNDKIVDSVINFPTVSCRYCGVSDPKCIVRCVETSKWYCNGNSGNASHVIQHLVKSGCKELSLHPDSNLGETVIECYNCGGKNAFLIGFIPAKGDSVVVLLCRNCLGNKNIKDLGWQLDDWCPLIQDRALVNWLVSIPNPDMAIRKSITMQQINKLEELWKIQPDAKFEDLNKPSAIKVEPISVKLRYVDALEFQKTFKPLVDMEANYDKEMKEHMKEDNISINWHKAEGSHRVTGELMFSLADNETSKINIGDELKISLSRLLMVSASSSGISIGVTYKGKNLLTSHPDHDWEGRGTVIKICDDGRIVIEMNGSSGVPLSVSDGYCVSYVWRPVTFDRMQEAMKTFVMEDSSLSGYLYHKILGHDTQDQILKVSSHIPKKLNAPGLPDLNESQADAIRQALERPLALIQGPPGTGKTVTTASLVYHLVKLNPGHPILVCAPSNVAVDQLTEKIDATGVRVVRIAAISREHIESNIDHLALHNMILNLGTKESDELRALLEKQESAPGNHLSGSDATKLKELRRKIEKEVLAAADVICTTCSGAADKRLAKKQRFHHVLLDEATQATEPESLIPIVMGCKQFILVGDHCQLGPVVMCKDAATAGLNSSLFERLVALGLRPIRLQVQYRMHPCLSEFPCNTFYEGTLQNGVSAEDRSRPDLDFPWPNKNKPLLFLSCIGQEELASTGTSYLNRTEAQNCERIVTALLIAGVLPSQIGVITPYDGQRIYITQTLQRGPLKIQTYKEIEVQSVDAFQGREKDYIILSCVRSNEKQGIGFLTDPRRLNVALTRARYGCIILGNPRVLSKRPLWNSLLVHCYEQGLLMEGTLGNLQPCTIKFQSTKKYFADRKQRVFEENFANTPLAPTLKSGDGLSSFASSSSNGVEKLDSRYDPRYSSSASILIPPPANIPAGTFQPFWGMNDGAENFGADQR